MIVGGQGGGPSGSSDAAVRTAWIEANCAAVTSVSTSLYDCSAATAAG